MPIEVKLRRGTTAQHSSFTGAAGEVTVDTTKNTAVVHDGSTAGGFPLAKSSDLTTANVSEVTNLYFTNTRAISAFTAGTGIEIAANGLITGSAAGAGAVDSVNGEVGTVVLTTANIAEDGSNVYYTDGRVQTYLDALSGNIVPDTDNVYSLGSATNRFKDLYLSGTTLFLGNVTLKDEGGTLSVLDSEGNTVFEANATLNYATETFVNTAISNLVDFAPAALDTLNELAAALGDDENFASTITTSIGNTYDQANAAFAAANTKVVAADLTTANVVEDTNLYFTTDRVYSNVTQLGYITSSSLSGYATNNQLTDYATVSSVGVVFNTANTAQSTAEAAFEAANAAGSSDAVVAAFATANLAYDQANVANGTAEQAFATANIVFSAYNQANVATSTAEAAFAAANAAGSAESVTIIFDQANAAFDAANTASVIAESAFDQANIANGTAEQAFAVANAAVVAADLTTANVAEVDNLYYTDARVYSNVASYLSGNVSVGDLTVAGNLVVQGETTTLNTTTLTVEDLNVVLAAGAPDAAAADGAGITIDGALANIIYSETNDWFDVSKSINISDTYGKVFFNSADAYVGVEPGIQQVIVSGAANQSVKIITDNDISGNGLYWLFDVSGNLTAPGYITGNIIGTVSSIDNHTTDNLSEGSNLYYTDGRVYSNVTQLGYITSSSLSGYATNSQLADYATVASVGVVYDVANTAQLTAEAAFEAANAAGSSDAIVAAFATANLAYDQANTASDIATLAYDTANISYSAFDAANVANGTAEQAFATANIVFSAFDAANVANGTAEQAFAVANAAVVAADLTTANITEDTNLYYTDARVYANVVAGNFATQSYVNGEVANLIASAPSTLDTLNELAAALGDDPNFATTTATLIGNSYNQANSAFAAANVANGTAQQAFATANIVYSAFNQANVANGSAEQAFAVANIVYSAFAAANVANGTAEQAFAVANAAVVAADLTTANVTEDTNLYFTNTRAVSAFTGGTGVNIDGNGLLTATVTGGVTSVAGATGDVSNIQLLDGINDTGYLTTANVTEVTNLYFTNTRAISAFTSGDNIEIAANGLVTANVAVTGGDTYNNTTQVTTLTQFSRFDFTASGSQTAFFGLDDNAELLSINPDYVEVYLNGIRLVPTTDYTSNATQITLTTGATASDLLSVINFVNAGATATADAYVGDGSNVDFTLSRTPANKASIFITIDGVKQHTSEYSIAGTTLTFNEAPPSSANVEVTHLSGSGAGQTPWTEAVTDFTATTGGRYIANTQAGSFTITLPASPSMGDVVEILDGTGNFATSNVLVARNSSNIMGQEEDLYLNVDNSRTELIFFNANYGWRLVS